MQLALLHFIATFKIVPAAAQQDVLFKAAAAMTRASVGHIAHHTRLAAASDAKYNEAGSVTTVVPAVGNLTSGQRQRQRACVKHRFDGEGQTSGKQPKRKQPDRIPGVAGLDCHRGKHLQLQSLAVPLCWQHRFVQWSSSCGPGQDSAISASLEYCTALTYAEVEFDKLRADALQWNI